MTGICPAENMLINLSCKGADPLTTAFTLPPNAALHLLKINLLAIDNWIRYHKLPGFELSYFLPNSTAQKNSALLIPFNSIPVINIFSYTFSNNLGTQVNTIGCTSFKFSPMVSMLSA